MGADQRLPAQLLIVDDDPLISQSLAYALENLFDVTLAATRAEALARLERAPRTALALVDLGLPPAAQVPDEGFALIEAIAARFPSVRPIVLSGQNDAGNIHHALTLGATDFIAKPVDLEVLKARLTHHLEVQRASLPAQDRAAPVEARLPGVSRRIAALNDLIARFADAPHPVLVVGESGVGKELAARALCAGSARSEGPFLALNCAALPSDLLEAQLFGAARGAYTGATADARGFFEAADQGTLFLDEIAELSPPLQAKLLRVLENGEYYRLGETSPRVSRARIITATNRDLAAAVRLGDFREDLFHRLHVLVVEVPPLREREGDIPWLFERFVGELGVGLELDDGAWQVLTAYDFPGNVRELRNVVIRLAAKHGGQKIDATTMADELRLSDARMPAITDAPAAADLKARLKAGEFRLDRELMRLEQAYIDAALELADGKLAGAARALGVNRSTLYSRIERLRRLVP